MKFLFGQPAFCRQPFLAAGRRYVKGEAFPYADLGLLEHDMRGLWLAELIEFRPVPINGTPVTRPESKQQQRHDRR